MAKVKNIIWNRCENIPLTMKSAMMLLQRKLNGLQVSGIQSSRHNVGDLARMQRTPEFFSATDP
jgi:hypothetical protein